MKATKRTKFIDEMDSTGENVTVKKPFKVEEQDNRKFIRIEISSPMSLQTLKDTHGGFWPDGNSRQTLKEWLSRVSVRLDTS